MAPRTTARNKQAKDKKEELSKSEATSNQHISLIISKEITKVKIANMPEIRLEVGMTW